MTIPSLLAIIAGGIFIYALGVYNSLVTFRTRIQASIQEIGNQLKRQSELIPNLEESAKGYLKHEKEIIKVLSDARKAVAEAVSSGDIDKMSQAGEKVANILPQMSVVVESNPQIKGNEVVTRLMDELRDTSDKIMYSRRTLIDLTADYNIKLATFPSNLVANTFGFRPEKGLTAPVSGSHLEVTSENTKSPQVKF
jgi:LemA protein